MIKEIIDTINANKGKIIKRTLIIGGSAIGLAIVAKVVTLKSNEGEKIDSLEAEEVKDLEADDHTKENG